MLNGWSCYNPLRQLKLSHKKWTRGVRSSHTAHLAVQWHCVRNTIVPFVYECTGNHSVIYLFLTDMWIPPSRATTPLLNSAPCLLVRYRYCVTEQLFIDRLPCHINDTDCLRRNKSNGESWFQSLDDPPQFKKRNHLNKITRYRFCNLYRLSRRVFIGNKLSKLCHRCSMVFYQGLRTERFHKSFTVPSETN